MENYAYSINDDLGGNVNYTQLLQEIRDSAITSAVFQYQETNGDTLLLWFDQALSPGDEDVLDAVIAAHSPSVTTQSAQTTKDIGESSTTETTWQEKLSATLPPLKKGDYTFYWYVEMKTTAPGVAAQVTYNGNEQAYSVWGENQYHAFSGSVVANMEEGAAPTIAINYKALGSGTAYVRRARLAAVLLDKEV